MKTPTKQTLRRKADALLQQYIRKSHQIEPCYLCGEKPVQVGHHFIHKSQSNATRYYLPNIIPLCNPCHCLIHKQQGLQNARIAIRMGKEWLDNLEQVKRYGQKFTKEWVETNIKILEELWTP